MAQISAEHSSRLAFRFESDDTASFLVLDCDAKVLEYQALMLEHNRIRHVLPVDVVVKEGASCYYYNITSKISLSFLLARRKLGREEFLKLLLNIVSVVNDSAGYLLTSSNFVFHPEYIYINPETMEPMLVYIPAALEGGSRTTFQSFVSELLMQHINMEGFDKGNLVQRILSEVNSELFNTKSLIVVVNDLLYAGMPETEDFFDSDPSEDRTSPPAKEIRTKTDPGKRLHSGSAKARNGIHPLTLLVILAQVVMGILIFAARNFLNKVGGNPTATYAAIVMIVLSIDLLLFKRLREANLIRIGSLQGSNSQDAREEGVNSARTATNRIREVIREKRRDTQQESRSTPERDTWDEEFSRTEPSSITPGLSLAESRTEYSSKRPNPITPNPIGPNPNGPGGGFAPAGGKSVTIGRNPADPGCNRAYFGTGAPGRGFPDGVLADALTETAVASVSKGPVTAGFGKERAAGKDFPPAAASGKTELLSSRSRGVRMLKCTGKLSSDEDIFISKDDFIIGRLSDHVDHVIRNNAVGKLHAQVLVRNGACFIKDLNSVNGTFVNGKRLESNKEFEIRENDRILLANSEFIYTPG